MTYLAPPTRHHRTRRPQAMGGWFENLVRTMSGQPGPEVSCLNEANAKVAPLDARIEALARDWNPTGFYTPGQAAAILTEGMKIGTASNDAVRAAPLSTGDAQTVRNMALKDVWRKFDEAQKYLTAIKEAEAKGAPAINAPGLKDWFLGILRASSQSLVTAATLECRMPWLATVIIKFQGLFDIAAGVVKKIAGIAVAVGETVINVAGDLPQIWTVVKWGGLAAVAAAVAVKLGQMRRRQS